MDHEALQFRLHVDNVFAILEDAQRGGSPVFTRELLKPLSESLASIVRCNASGASLSMLACRTWEEPRKRAAVIELLAVCLRELTAALHGVTGACASAGKGLRHGFSSPEMECYSTCFSASVELLSGVSVLPDPTLHAPYVLDLLLRTHMPQALSQLFAALTTALHEEPSPLCSHVRKSAVAALEQLLILVTSSHGQPIPYGPVPPRPHGHSSTAASTQRTGDLGSRSRGSTSSSGRRVASQPAVKPMRACKAAWRCLADSNLLEHCCRAALAGDVEEGILEALSYVLSALGALSMGNKLHKDTLAAEVSILAARDAILSGPCLQYMLHADVLSQMHHSGYGLLYGMPVRHIFPRKQTFSDALEVIHLLHLVCTAVPGPMLLQHELRHSRVAVARAWMWNLREVLQVLRRTAGEPSLAERTKRNPVGCLFMVSAAKGLLHGMRLGPSYSNAATPVTTTAGAVDREAAPQAGSRSNKPCTRVSGRGSRRRGSVGAAPAAAAVFAAGGQGAKEQPWTPGRRGGRQLLREWWAAAVPVVHAVLDKGLVPLAGAAACADGARVALSEKAVRELVETVSIEATVVDRLLPGLPLAPKPTPNVAAALSAGYVPCLERLMRLTQRSVGDGASADAHGATVLLGPLAGWPLLLQLMAYGDVRQVAALVVTAGKLVGRQARGGSLAEASRLALEQRERRGDAGPLLRAPTCAPNGLLWAMYMQLVHSELLPGWHWDEQLRRWQESGGKSGPAAVGTSSTCGGGSGSNGVGYSGTGARASSGKPSASTAAAAAGTPQLPPPTRQALRLLSLAAVRWTAACLHNVNWAAEQGAPPEAVGASATAVLDMLSTMNLCLCARSLAVARGDTRAADSWRHALVHGMGLPGSLGPVLRLLSVVQPSCPAMGYAAAAGGVAIAWCAVALSEEWCAAVGGAAAATPLWAAVEGFVGPNGSGRGSDLAQALYEAFSTWRQVSRRGAGEPVVVQAMRVMLTTDGDHVPAAALLPPPCEAVEGEGLSLLTHGATGWRGTAGRAAAAAVRGVQGGVVLLPGVPGGALEGGRAQGGMQAQGQGAVVFAGGHLWDARPVPCRHCCRCMRVVCSWTHG